MKLYYSPGACSLATRISLHEAGIAATFERVDLRAKVTETGADYTAINPAGSVPMLLLSDGTAITENVAILDLLAEHEPRLGVNGSLGRTRLIEMLSFLSTELHHIGQAGHTARRAGARPRGYCRGRAMDDEFQPRDDNARAPDRSDPRGRLRGVRVRAGRLDHRRRLRT